VTSAAKLSNKLQHWITPGLRYSQASFEDRLREHIPKAQRWLDLGCGHRLLSEWRHDAEKALVASVPLAVGIDADFDALRRHRTLSKLCLGDITKLPFANESFDLVTANMVVEHLDNPATQFKEVGRVLSRGGRFVFHTPNAQSYVIGAARLMPDPLKKTLARVLEGRVAEDVYPTHYLANRRSQIERVAEASGLAIDELEFVASAPVLGAIPPLAALELLWIRQLQRRPSLAKFRTTLICVLRKA
jgi:ubiquinone/menaquinone biosynthesis C-methylase UbiE